MQIRVTHRGWVASTSQHATSSLMHQFATGMQKSLRRVQNGLSPGICRICPRESSLSSSKPMGESKDVLYHTRSLRKLLVHIWLTSVCATSLEAANSYGFEFEPIHLLQPHRDISNNTMNVECGCFSSCKELALATAAGAGFRKLQPAL